MGVEWVAEAGGAAEALWGLLGHPHPRSGFHLGISDFPPPKSTRYEWILTLRTLSHPSPSALLPPETSLFPHPGLPFPLERASFLHCLLCPTAVNIAT